MIDLFKKFNDLNRSIKDVQYPIAVKGAIKAYYGISAEGLFRIAFLSTNKTNIEGTTKSIAVIRGNSGKNNYWTCFDLKNDDLLSVFCCFGEDIVSCVENEPNEPIAANKLRGRYKTWQALFRKPRTPLSEEKAKGLFGELYFLKNVLLTIYAENQAITGWSGPDKYNKDFAIEDTWFEVKTINPSSPVVKISSLQQLSASNLGYLVIIRVEEMAAAYSGLDNSINAIIQTIVSTLKAPDVKDLFLSKVAEYGYDFADDIGNKKYLVKGEEKYVVDHDFPILREEDINSNAVNNVSYELIIRQIKKWLKGDAK